MKRKSKPSDHLLLGLAVITLEVGVTWYYYIKGKLKSKQARKPIGESERPISDEAFEEELARTSANNGNGKIVDEPCPCDDEPVPPSADLDEPEEELDTPVPSLPADPEPPEPVEPETPETDTH